MQLPLPRGPVTERLVEVLRAGAAPLARRGDVAPLVSRGDVADPIADEDLQLALWICYELHYRGFEGVAPEREWDLRVLELRRELEAAFLGSLRRQVHVPPGDAPVSERLTALVEVDDGPPISRFLQRRASRAQFEEFAIHRSVYQLKEADPHSWAIPRLAGRAKAALVEIQADEYGSGSAARMHSELFRATLRGLGLEDAYGCYVDIVPAVTLATSNVISLFGLHRELRGALVGHLAAFEMTSSIPNRRYSQGLRRLGAEEATRRFYDVHVTADALHEQLAAYDLCGGLVAEEPALTEDILFGAACCLYLDNRFAAEVLRDWSAGCSSLRRVPSAATPIAADVS